MRMAQLESGALGSNLVHKSEITIHYENGLKANRLILPMKTQYRGSAIKGCFFTRT